MRLPWKYNLVLSFFKKNVLLCKKNQISDNRMKTILFVILCTLAYPIHAQTNKAGIKGAASTANTGVGRDAKKLPQAKDSVNWKKGGDVSLNFSQIHLSETWAAGGESSLSISSSANLFANYKKDKLIWENYAFMAYGIVKAEKRESVKNSDLINMGSRVGYQMASKWYYTAALLGRTQFAPGYKYTAVDTTRVSDFLAPAYLFLSLGLDYKPSSNFFISFAPAMGKATFVRSDDEMVKASAGIPKPENPDEARKKARYEFGAGMVFNLKGDYFDKRVTYTTQLELFSNYFENPLDCWDVVWDFQFRVALTKFVAASIRINMLYNDSQKTYITKEVNGVIVKEEHGAKIQLKQFFEIGLYYPF